MEITAMQQSIEKRMKRNEDSLRDIWDNIKHRDQLGLVPGRWRPNRELRRQYSKS